MVQQHRTTVLNAIADQPVYKVHMMCACHVVSLFLLHCYYKLDFAEQLGEIIACRPHWGLTTQLAQLQ